MATPMARVPVTSPTFTPLPYGLLSVVQTPPTADVHWQLGVLHQPDACDAAKTTIDPCPVNVTGFTKSPTSTGIGIMGADPFTVFARVDCGPIGADPNEYIDRAIAALERGEPRAVETVFWTGTTSVTGAPQISPHLAANVQVVGPSGEISQLAASPVTTGTGVDVVEAMGLLEGALATCYGGVGVIHVPRAALPHLKNHGLFYHDETNGVLVTCGGNLLAAYSGAGVGTSPAGGNPPTGDTWFYATGAIEMFKGPATTTSTFEEAIDKGENQLVLIAERTYVLTWDCCLFAAQVQLGGDIQGAIGARN